ncbi:HD family phosphohydrolase [Dethiobacter alkaliphilus]|uniref:7TM receptor with intracellular metal dependent phosphohydrolase n=1 Tax=Dethiobacter alkaliphilus AHT 1 TaxID=555088 RepID=C0GEJ9_DETAL|nr:HDIG domain-containing metalloprotein [Dethiobacter alkaliphilus]EEG78031.1 7TM receptor with intracellular metal dependent phosphohydrolase [Dethiobacter alkaliphilus AHT 1]
MGVGSRFQDLLDKKDILKGNARWQRILLAVIFYLLILFILFFALSATRVDLELGRPSPRKIVAEWDAIDTYTTNQLREAAAEAVQESYDYDPTVLGRAEERVESFFAAVKDVRADEETEPEERAELLDSLTEVELNETLAESLLEARSQDLTEMQLQLMETVEMVLQQGVKPPGLETARRQAVQEINMMLFTQDQRRALGKLAQEIIEPNMIYNAEATMLAREAARQAVQPVRILRGTEIISEREIVTERHLAQLEALGLLRDTTGYSMFFGLAMILLGLFIVVGIYLFIFQTDIYHDNSLLTLLGLIALITLTFTIAANYFSGYLVPVAMGTILIAVLLNSGLAVLMSMVFAVFVALITGNDFRFMLVALFGGLIAIYSTAHLSRRSDLTKAGFYVAALNVITVIGLFLYIGTLRFEYDLLREFSISILAAIGNGLFSSVMAIGLLPYLESGFGLTTSVTLLELANPNHPLLKKLLMEAPGTYHHSLVVANLAEAAAERIGADPLMARVGAFYHDIGKLKRPYFFIENQHGENPHEKISPNLSTLIITSHVKDGMEMARKGKLPKVIQDIIVQHHGNSMVSYFYHLAEKCRDGKDNLCEDNFRYEAPLPQSKEAAIILLADSVEAAARSMPKPVAGRIESIVRKIIREKLNDGQFDQCDITLRELDIVGETFVKILSGIYHTRVEYPEKELKAEIERSRKNDGPVE